MNLFRQIPHNKPTAETVINPRSQKASQEYIAPDFSIIYLTEMQKKQNEMTSQYTRSSKEIIKIPCGKILRITRIPSYAANAIIPNRKNVQKSCPLPLNRTTFQRHPGQVFRNIEAYPRFHQFPLLFSAGPAGLREVLFP